MAVKATEILGAFAKLRKVTISSVMSCLSVCPHGTTPLPLDGFPLIRYLIILRKLSEKIPISLSQCDKSGGLNLRTAGRSGHVSPVPSQNEECFTQKLWTKPKFPFCAQYIFFSFSKIVRVHEIMWGKYCRAGQATDGNMAHYASHAGYRSLKTHTHNM